MAVRIGGLQQGTFRQVVWNLGLIFIGSAISAVAINGILVPLQFFSGGFAGLALILHYLFPVLPVGVLYFLLNVPLFALGWQHVGRRFFLYSLAGMVIFSALLKWVSVTIPVKDPILAAMLAGIIGGAGGGIIFRSLGSSGGLDILSVMLLQRFSIRLGTTSLGFNLVILMGAAAIYSLEKALYALIYIYVYAYVTNVVVSGLSQRKAAFIISSRWQEISREIFDRLNRGLTIIEGRGGYTGQKEDILYVVLTFRELPRLKQIVRQVDPKAFMVVTDTLEVMGHRIGNQPHW
jgi:uncharacterized membrane-anchored protein YitT (DUF2179 family)